ncbi:MAG: SIR2 family protein [Dehalococcoidia bacterium]|nr:SIR2 family protein [Dehalococcoidia bacterium]
MPGPFYNAESEKNFQELVNGVREGFVTAFLGAGLSAGTNLTWRALHTLMQEQAGCAPKRPFRPDAAPVDFQEFRSALGDQRFLEIMKQLFARPITEPPGLYRIIDEISNIDPLITANYDENLASVALASGRRFELCSYPELRAKSRYMYLHGRAATATEVRDLVVCSDDYMRAYGEGGAAALILKAHFIQSVVFIGSSLTDPDLNEVLRATYRYLHIWQDRSVPMFAILPAESNPANGDLPLAEQIAIETSRFEARGLQPIWYVWDPDHTQLRIVLRRLQRETQPTLREPTFLRTAERLDDLGGREHPSPEEQRQLLELIRAVPEYARHFFTHATSPKWFDVLLEAGMLTAVVEPKADSEGRVRIVPWAAAEYVRRIAKTRPEAVVMTLQRLAGTENWHVRSVLAELASGLPNDHVQTALPILCQWLDSRYRADLLVGHYLVGLATRLAEEREASLGIQLLAALTKPKMARGTSVVELQVEDHELERLKPAVAALMKVDAEAIYRLFRDRLIETLELEYGGLVSRLRRPVIEDHDANDRRFDQALHFLVDGFRDALLAFVDTKPREGARELVRLLSSDEDMLRRVALHTLTQRPDLISTATVRPITRERLFDVAGCHEFGRLLRTHFARLPAKLQDLVHEGVVRGPETGEATDDDRSRILASWRWRLLSNIPKSSQTKQEKRWLRELRTKWGEREEPIRTWTWTWSPALGGGRDLSEVRKKGPDAVLGELRNTQGQWDEVRGLVREDPEGMLALAPKVSRHDFPNAWPYLDSYREAMKERRTFAWLPLIEMIERLAADLADSARDTEWAVSDLLRDGLANSEFGVPTDLLNRAFAVAVALLDRSARPLERGLPERKDLEFHQLNEPAGRAADSFMLYVWRKAILGGDEARTIPEEVRGRIEHALSGGWGGMELRHAFGQYIRTLEWCDPGWLLKSIKSLWPEGAGEAEVAARVAFFNGYLWGSAPLAKDVMRALVPQYRQVIPDVAVDDPIYLSERDLREQFAVHIVVGWILDVDGFSFDGLLGELLRVAPDEVRAHLVWFMGKEYDQATEPEWRDTLWTKMDEYWQGRSDALATLGAEDRSEELTRFCTWPSKVDASVEHFESRLHQAIDHVSVGFGIEQLLEYLSRKAEPEPRPCAALLDRIVRRWADDPEVYWIGRELEPTLAAILRSGGRPERQAVERIIGRLWMTGRGDFRHLLAD